MRTGVFFCQTADNRSLNIDSIAKYSANLPEVETVQILKLKPLPDLKFLREQITAYKLDRIVIAGDIPGYYKPVFTRAMAITGGDTDEIHLASFQEHGTRGENAMDRAKAIVACAVMGVPFPLAAVPGGNPVNHATLIVGGGIAGIQSALEIAKIGRAHV